MLYEMKRYHLADCVGFLFKFKVLNLARGIVKRNKTIPSLTLNKWLLDRKQKIC